MCRQIDRLTDLSFLLQPKYNRHLLHNVGIFNQFLKKLLNQYFQNSIQLPSMYDKKNFGNGFE